MSPLPVDAESKKWSRVLTYSDSQGGTATWVEEKCTAEHAWGLGCKICRWNGEQTALGLTCARGWNATRFVELRRHGGHVHGSASGGHQSHARAQAALLENRKTPPSSTAPDRNDVPCFAMCYNAYKGALAGASFKSYEADLKAVRASGAPIPKSRFSREVAKQIVICVKEELCEEDRQLLEHATDINLSMDGRKSAILARCRLVLGDGWPPGMCPLDIPPQAEGEDNPPETEWEDNPPRMIKNAFGKYISTVDRLISFKRVGPSDTGATALSNHLVDGLKEACGGDGDLWENVRAKVRVFTPDGAPDEQLGGRLAAETFPNLALVLRCSTHAVVSAIEKGWEADETAQRITTTVVQEVAKYIRSSERFALSVGVKAHSEAVAAVTNFSFAPQRFASRERPLTRFVLFAKAVIEALGFEAAVPTSKSRQKWAVKILAELDGPTWTMIGMLADLSDDCARFVALLDERELDPIDFATALQDFLKHLDTEYVQGHMWLRRKGTYTKRVMEMLQTAQVVQFGQGYTVLQRPSKRESEVCQARVSNVAIAICEYLRGQIPDFSAQMLLRCFKVPKTAAESQVGPQPLPECLRELLRIMGWGADERTECVHHYLSAWPSVVGLKRTDGLSDRDAWAKFVVEVSPQSASLKRIVTVAIGMLLTETECERSFSAERRQHDHRPRLGPGMRFAGLKVMNDGVPLERLHQDGKPIGNFWQRIQERYAAKFGVRFLQNVVQRSDKGLKRKKCDMRAGKETLTAFKRRRLHALQETPSLVFGSQRCNVFGHEPMAIAQAERLREAEQTAVFHKIVEKARCSFEKRRKEHLALRSAAPGARLPKLAAHDLNKIEKKAQKRRAAFATSCIAGGLKWTWRTLLRSFGGTGSPWIYMDNGVADKLEGRGLDETFGGKALKECVTTNLRNYVENPIAPLRRIILVANMAHVSWELQLAAVVLGARMQTQVLRPLLLYKLVAPLTLAFTAEFAQKHKQVVTVARAAFRRHAVRGHRESQFCEPSSFCAGCQPRHRRS